MNWLDRISKRKIKIIIMIFKYTNNSKRKIKIIMIFKYTNSKSIIKII